MEVVAVFIALLGASVLVLVFIGRDEGWARQTKGSRRPKRMRVRFEESLDLTAGAAAPPPKRDFVSFAAAGAQPSRVFGLFRLTVLMAFVAALIAAGLWEVGHLLLRALSSYVNAS